MLVKKCFVFNCDSDENNENTGVTFHHFPMLGKTNVQRCRLWAEFCQPNVDWSDVKDLKKLCTSHKYVCGRHFKADAYNEVNPSKLTLYSIPSINPLVTNPSHPPANVSTSVPSSSFRNSSLDHETSLLPDHSPLPFLRMSVTPSLETPSLSHVMPSTPTIRNAPHSSQTPVTLPSKRNSSPQKSATGSSTRRSLLNKLHVTRIAQLSPKNQWLVKSHKKLQKKYARMKKQYDDLKKRSKAHVLELSVFKNLPPELKHILASTIKSAERSPNGRRWSLPDKIQALSLFKKSPQNYNFLRTLFLLPSPSTLRPLLGTCPSPQEFANLC